MDRHSQKCSTQTLIASIFNIFVVVVAMFWISFQQSQIQDQQSKLNLREQWMAEDYVAKVKASRDRYTLLSHTRWESAFAAKNGLITVPAEKFEPLTFPKPPISDEKWQWVQEQIRED